MSMKAPPYPSGHAHLNDELWRVWLRVEYQLRLRWERGFAGQSAPGPGSPAAEQAAALFRFAQDQHHQTLQAASGEGSANVLATYLHLTQSIDARIAASEESGVHLPLVDLARRFQLTRYQVASLMFALMPELDPELLTMYRTLSHDPHCRGLDGRLLAQLVYDTPESRVQLALDLSPRSPLISHRLLEIEESVEARHSLLHQRIWPAPRLLLLLQDSRPTVDPRLLDMLRCEEDEEADGLFPEELVAQVGAALRSEEPLVLLLHGQQGVGKRLLLRTAAAAVGRRLLFIGARRLATTPAAELPAVLGAIVRECRLLSALPVLADLDALTLQSEPRDDLPPFVEQLHEIMGGLVAITWSRDRLPRVNKTPLVHIAVPLPTLLERRELWQRYTPGIRQQDATLLASRFATTGGIIRMAARAAHALRPPRSGAPSVEELDQALRGQLHDRLTRLGRKLDTPFEFEDLVVDSDVWDTLCELLACMRNRRVVREGWGIRGAPGVAVLFSGDPGVGKTMSATVVAKTLGLEIYEIDLAQVVSKWLGETEKNLAEVFDAAEPGHVVLLFNEADALFNKRTSEVKNANDRYSNLETNYLLQRLERFGGLAILTSNLTNNIDPAFRRRFAFDVQFSFPSVEMRAEIWQRALPPRGYVADVDSEALAERFELSGGFIKVAVERAAMTAAGLREPLSTELLISTVERMYRERGKLSAVGRLE